MSSSYTLQLQKSYRSLNSPGQTRAFSFYVLSGLSMTKVQNKKTLSTKFIADINPT